MKRKVELKMWMGSLVVGAIMLVAAPSHVFAKAAKVTEVGIEDQLKFKEGDETGNEVKALKTELLVIKAEKRALDQLLKLQKKYTGTRMEPDILFRLAELYMRRARSERFFEVHRNSDQIVMFTPQMVKNASESTEIKKAVGIYARLQEKFPGFRSMDIVIFNNAYAHQQVGNDKEAERLLKGLIASHPDSGLIPDSYLSLGEIYFGRREFPVALENFKAIRKYPRARVFPYGMYKAAWCYYNMQDATSGIKQLEDVIKFGREMSQGQANSKLDLRKEALGDLALFFSDVMPSAKAVDYFMAQAGDLDAGPYLLRLAELYKRQSRHADIESLLKDFLVKIPKSEATAQVHEELVWNYERMKQRPQAIAQLGNFDKFCADETEALPKKIAAMKKKGEKLPTNTTRAECQDKIADASKKLALKWHSSWQKQFAELGGGDDLAKSTEQSYRLYLKNADTKDAELPSTRFTFAELLFRRGQFREASTHYASIDGYQKSGMKVEQKISHEAAYGAILSLEKANSDKWNEADEKLFVELSDIYIKRFPQGQYVLELRFKRAFIAYEKGRYDEAAPQLKKIGWSNDRLPAGSATDRVVRAQDLYLDILNIKKDYKALRESAALLLKGGMTGPRVTQIEKIYREAYFSEIQQMEEKGELVAAIETYKKFALENTNSELAPKAWWNASQLQFRLGDAQGGANTCYQMHKIFPKSTNGKDCLTKAASTFEAMGRLDLAARVLLNLALVEPAKQDQWREVAADFFGLSGNRESKDRATTMYLKLAETKKGADQVRMYDKAATLAREMGDNKTLAQIEAKYSAGGIEPQSSRLVVEQAEEALVKNDWTKAFNLSKKIIGRESLPKDLLARARYVQAQVLEDEYRKQSVKSKVERMGLVLSMKTEKLEKAQKAYQSAIHYGDPGTSIKALRRLADCYMDYSRTVKGMQLPGATSEADVQAFRAEIDQLAIPMEEKGIEAMSQALEVAKKAQLRDGQVAVIQAEINKINMKTGSQPSVVVMQPAVYMPEFRGPASQGGG
jgi:TolA-binding protein